MLAHAHKLRNALNPGVLGGSGSWFKTGACSAGGQDVPTWVRERFNPFVEAQAGRFEVINDMGHEGSLQAGLSAGLDWLFGGTWGLRVWTGILLLYHDGAMYEIPLRWGFTGYL